MCCRRRNVNPCLASRAPSRICKSGVARGVALARINPSNRSTPGVTNPNAALSFRFCSALYFKITKQIAFCGWGLIYINALPCHLNWDSKSCLNTGLAPPSHVSLSIKCPRYPDRVAWFTGKQIRRLFIRNLRCSAVPICKSMCYDTLLKPRESLD